jgi:hypothetical protein
MSDPSKAAKPAAAPAPTAAPVVQVPWEEHRARMYQESVTEAAETEMDETVEGGRYLAPYGSTVDADGKPIKESKAAADKGGE